MSGGADPRAALVEHITACWRTQALHAAVQLDLPEHLAGGARSAAALARDCGADADALQRLLHALCTLQVCRPRRDGRFELTAAGALLARAPRDGSPSLRAMVQWWGGPLWPTWGDLAYSVRTGQSARARQNGLPNYGFLDDRPELAALFHDAMRALTATIAAEVAALPRWRQARELVDVGGGHGELAAAIAAAHRRVRVTVLDCAHAEPGARERFARQGLGARARFVAGDFFERVPPGADTYLLKSILHNWDDAACGRLLARCAEAAPPGARLLLVERVRPERLKPTRRDRALARTDLNMLAGLGGRERTLNEYAALLEAAGFGIVGCTPLQHEFSVIEAQCSAPTDATIGASAAWMRAP